MVAERDAKITDLKEQVGIAEGAWQRWSSVLACWSCWPVVASQHRCWWYTDIVDYLADYWLHQIAARRCSAVLAACMQVRDLMVFLDAQQHIQRSQEGLEGGTVLPVPQQPQPARRRGRGR